METLVLPAQDQWACHQNGRSKRIWRSSSTQPRSHGNSCASSSQFGTADTGFPMKSSSSEDSARFQSDPSASRAPVLVEKQSFVAKALTLRFFHPSSRSQSRGSASLPRPAAANCSVQEEAHDSDTGFGSAPSRSFSVPKGHCWRRSESAPRKVLQSEASFITAESPSCQPKSRKKGSSEAKAASGTQLARKLERFSGSGRSSFERSSVNTEDKHRTIRTGFSTSSVKDDSKTTVVTPAVTILQRPKSKDAAMSNLARVLAGGGESLDLLNTVSTSVCLTVGGGKDCTLRAETLSAKPSLTGLVDFQNPPLANGVMSVNNPGSKDNCEVPFARSSPDAVMVCASGKTMEHVWRETMACVPLERSGSTQPILNNQGKRLLSGDLKAMFTGSFLITSEASIREDFSACSSPPLNERWAGPAYSNSPPPSSLPLPKFSMRQLRTTSLEIPRTEAEFCEDSFGPGSLSAPSTPSRSLQTLSSKSSSTAGILSLNLDAASATKDLRRILNLDAEI